jgi:chaperonin GroEL
LKLITISIIFQHGYGWNAANNKYCDLMEAGVVDPAKVTINAVENSASVAGLVLTTECLVTEIPVIETEDDRQRRFDAEGMGMGMGGM